MATTETPSEPQRASAHAAPDDLDDWQASLEEVRESDGDEAAASLIARLADRARELGLAVSSALETPYLNTIPHDREPRYPGNLDLEHRIRTLVRWNAMAMVVRANREHPGIGGHISTYASTATLFEVGFNHFFHAPSADHPGDIVYFQGHASPGVYARAYVEGRLGDAELSRFRREASGGRGLSSYPHPRLMSDFWQFPSVSMGLSPLMAIYQARFNRYLQDRELRDTSKMKVWCFLGDGECDEPEALGSISLAAREHLDNLIFVVNCNLQRLDGPVRGNGKIIQELERLFHGAGWNVIKLIWGSDWDPLLAADEHGALVAKMTATVDGQYQKYSASQGDYIREHFFDTPELAALVEHLTDDELRRLSRGGHDPHKVYAAYRAAVEHRGQPTVILAKTVKGYGLGEAGEGRNVTHQQKKLNERELREFRARFAVPIGDDELAETPFHRPPDDAPEAVYLRERREALGGFLPARDVRIEAIDPPAADAYAELFAGSGEREVATTMAFVRLLGRLLADKTFGRRIVPIVPDEARTFGMDALFRRHGIYSHAGQHYEPVDRESLLYYREATDGQILEEGITEAGSMSSFIAAGTAYATHGLETIPFFLFYSMFGFQRIGDLIWAAADSRAKGFLCGATAGRTTLAGEGLQHQDGHSHLTASAVANVIAYDAAFAYELAVIVRDGMRRMVGEHEDHLYYLTLYNEAYRMPALPDGAEDGILRGGYRISSVDGDRGRVQLFGSGPIVREALAAQQLLAERYAIGSDVWSITSYSELRRDSLAVARWNRLHPEQPPRTSYLERALAGARGPFIAASDYVKLVTEQIARFLPGPMVALGTDGFGLSDTRDALRRFFEVDAASIAFAALAALADEGTLERSEVARAIGDLGIDTERADPSTA